MDQTLCANIERECARLVTAYTHFIDFGEAERAVDLFTLDGVFESAESTVRGADELRQRWRARQGMTSRISRHVCTNLAINVIDTDHADGVVYFTLYRHDGDTAGQPAPLNGPAMVGQYRDRFVRTADGWRFAHRKIELAFFRPEP